MCRDLTSEAIHHWFWNIAVQGHFHKTGWVVDKYDNAFSDAVRQSFVERGGDYTRDVKAQELEKFKVLEGLNDYELGKAYFNAEAGWCDAEKATTSFLKVAMSNVVKRLTGEITKLLLDGNKSRITGVQTKDRQKFYAERIVLAADAWSSALLSPIEDDLNIAPSDRIERQITAVGRLSACYTLSADETHSIIDSKMLIMVIGDQIELIPLSKPNRTLNINDLKAEVVYKTMTSSGHIVTAPSPSHQSAVPEVLKRHSSKIVAHTLPYLTSTNSPVRWRVYFDAVTPTEDWLLCQHPHPALTKLVVAVGGSFHNYRFLPVAGKYVSRVLNGEGCGGGKDEKWR
ncbi:FAD dependent oxidoreductase [Phaeosphaeriaceae sp. PMI808]|nr:FAD dependent oxidoreductase [Phaeosphaeriaceae sp. PMI808]